MLYAGQRGLIVGASGGIGREIARDLIVNGCDVALTFRGRCGPVDELAALAGSLGRRCLSLTLDVRQRDGVAAVCRQVAEELGTPTLLVCCAGVLRDRPLAAMEAADWHEVIDTNLAGTFHVIRQIAPLMMHGRGGRILTVASVSGLFGQAGQASYAAAKGGVIAMTRALARELGPFNITVNALAPGIVETEMTEQVAAPVRRRLLERTPLRRFAIPADLIPAVQLFLAPCAAYVTGQVLAVDGGLSC
jgi:3-oxoacyl-[acyl-carrier protein] reductase